MQLAGGRGLELQIGLRFEQKWGLRIDSSRGRVSLAMWVPGPLAVNLSRLALDKYDFDEIEGRYYRPCNNAIMMTYYVLQSNRGFTASVGSSHIAFARLYTLQKIGAKYWGANRE